MFSAIITILASSLVALGPDDAQFAESNFAVFSEDPSLIALKCETPALTLSTVEGTFNNYTEVILPGEGRLSIEGAPDLPVIYRSLIVPEGVDYRLEISGLSNEEIRLNSVPLPYFEDISDLQAFIENNHEAHLYDDFEGQLIPPDPVSIGSPVNFRGYTLLPLSIYPIQYNPSTNSILNHSEISVSLHADPSQLLIDNSVDLSAELTRDTYRFLKAFTLNPPHRDDDGETLPRGGYLIAVGTTFSRNQTEAIVNRLADWKRSIGHHVEVVWGADSGPTLLQNVVRPAYRDWQPKLEYLCLIGFYGNPSSPTQRADPMFGLLEGNDHIAEIAVGRLGSTSNDHLDNVISRTLGYQQTPYTGGEMRWFGQAGAAAYSVNGWLESVRYTIKWVAEAERRAGYNPVWTYFNGENNQNGDAGNWLSNDVNILFMRGGVISSLRSVLFRW